MVPAAGRHIADDSLVMATLFPLGRSPAGFGGENSLPGQALQAQPGPVWFAQRRSDTLGTQPPRFAAASCIKRMEPLGLDDREAWHLHKIIVAVKSDQGTHHLTWSGDPGLLLRRLAKTGKAQPDEIRSFGWSSRSTHYSTQDCGHWPEYSLPRTQDRSVRLRMSRDLVVPFRPNR
jgi:hypothetical protein